MGTNGGYGRGRPRFTDDQRRDILARHDRGESARTIARDYGCSSAAIYYHLKTTLRHVPLRDRYMAAPVATGGGCVRCGIAMGRPGMCLDCLEGRGVRGRRVVKGCTCGKNAYPTRLLAIRAALASSRRAGRPLRIYPCPDVKAWHLTKNVRRAQA